MKWLAILLPFLGCASPGLPPARFANAPVVEVVDDRRDVPIVPEYRDPELALYYFDGSFLRLLTRALAVPAPQRALGVNALDDVPDSTWFTNRIGVRALTLEQVRRGPELMGSPEPYKPWKVIGTKPNGRALGYEIVDARGVKFLLKFDLVGFPESESTADAITSRVLWACGYNVPEDHVVYLRREELVIVPTATFRDEARHVLALTPADLDHQLERAQVEPDGRIRALASRILDGTSVGSRSDRGVRSDDINDRVPHQLRRDQRGRYALFAWLDNVDAKEQNTLDMWIADSMNPRQHYIKHYIVDFGNSLGVLAWTKSDPRPGYAYYVDFRDMFTSLATVGLYKRAWEDRGTPPAVTGVGQYTTTFNSGRWKPSSQSDEALRTADRFDGFWASKIMIRFTREQLGAIVDAARMTDPRARNYLVNTLVARQLMTARHWFALVAPVDQFTVTREGALCFDDLAVANRLQPRATRHYQVTPYDRAGSPRAKPSELVVDERGHSCSPLTLAPDRDGYTIVKISISGLASAAYVHVARDPATLAPRVIGVWRS